MERRCRVEGGGEASTSEPVTVMQTAEFFRSGVSGTARTSGSMERFASSFRGCSSGVASTPQQSWETATIAASWLTQHGMGSHSDRLAASETAPESATATMVMSALYISLNILRRGDHQRYKMVGQAGFEPATT